MMNYDFHISHFLLLLLICFLMGASAPAPTPAPTPTPLPLPDTNVDIMEVMRQPIPDRVVVLTFDDAIDSHYTNVAPVLKKYGFGATFFICQVVPEAQAAKRHIMTWDQIRALDKMGFEIGNHTYHHTIVKGLPRAKFIEELEGIENKCRQYQIPLPRSFCYPGTAEDLGDLPPLEEKGYLFARCGRERVYRPTVDHPLLVPCFGIQGDDPDRFHRDVAQARWGQAAVLMFHGVPDINDPRYSLAPARFEEYMKYLHDNHYTVIALRDLAKYVDPIKAREWFEQNGFTK